jgi:mannose-6-phosphate isomerase-like protein (cupin superfamily)
VFPNALRSAQAVHSVRDMHKATALLTVAALILGARVGAAEEKPFRGKIEKLTRENSDFRRVLFTGPNMQLVAMSLRPNEDIGEEVHQVDQCFFFLEGKGEAVIAGNPAPVAEHDAVCVPAGTPHNIRNTGSKPLKLYTLYAPPQHPAGTVHHTKADAQKGESAPGR